MRKLQTLGGVQCHEEHSVIIFAQLIDLRNQGNLFEEAGKRRAVGILVDFGLFFIGCCLTHQLSNVFASVLCRFFVVILQIVLIFRFVYNLLNKVCNAVALCIGAQLLNEIGKDLYLGSGSCQFREFLCSLEHGEQTDPVVMGNGCGLVNRCFADAALGDIENALRADVIPSVVDGSKVAQDVPNLHAVIEIVAAHDVIRDGLQNQPILEKTRLCIRPVQDGKILVGKVPVLAQIPLDVCGNEGGLVVSACEFPEMNPAALALIGPEALVLAAVIVGNHGIGGIQNVLG